MKEEFKYHPLYTEYKIGTQGTIIGVKGRPLKPKNNGKGYFTVGVGVNGESYTRLVHRLICETYLPNPENKREVNHINGIKSDNRLENLEWVTPSENRLHAINTGLLPTGEGTSCSKLTELEVNIIRDRINKKELLTSVMKDFPHVTKSTIIRAATGVCWSRVGTPTELTQENKQIGETKPNAKLTEENVRYILSQENIQGQQQLADMFNVNVASIWQIYQGITWTHVTGKPKKKLPPRKKKGIQCLKT